MTIECKNNVMKYNKPIQDRRSVRASYKRSMVDKNSFPV